MPVYYGGAFAHLQLPAPEGGEGRSLPPRRPQGGYCLYTREVGARFLEAIVAGEGVRVAARYCGFSLRTVKRWLRAGRVERRDPLLTEFYDRYNEIRWSVRLGTLMEIRNSKDVKAKIWFMERRYPEWRQKKTVDVRASGTVNVDFSVFKTVREAYEAADTVETMRATIMHDMKRREQLRKELERRARTNGNNGQTSTDG
jgi:hypothetical protein